MVEINCVNLMFLVNISNTTLHEGTQAEKTGSIASRREVLFAVREGVSSCHRKCLPVVISCSEISGYCCCLICAQPIYWLHISFMT